MQHDDVIWSIIDKHFCSFKAKISKKDVFCRNPYNVNGICSKATCPLANSRYATIREEEGICYLYMKTIERAHTPKNLWEKVKLSRNYKKAIEKVDECLQYWPGHQIHRNKQRLTKIHQYLARMRKLRMQVRPKLVRVHKKVEKRDIAREKKALKAAHIDRSIKEELLDRLKKGTYGDIYNFPQAEFEEVLGEKESEFDEAEGSVEAEEGEGGDEEEEEEEEGVEYVEGDFEDDSDMEDLEEFLGDGSDEEGESRMVDEDASDDGEGADDGDEDGSRGRPQPPPKKRRKATPTAPGDRKGRPRVEIEYEEEETEEMAKEIAK